MQAHNKGSEAVRRIVIVDDHPIVRRGLAELIGQDPTLAVCGEAGSAPEAMKCIAETKPDMAIIDVGLEGSSGIDLTRQLRIIYPSLPILVLSMHEEGLYAERAFRAGASGYLMKSEAPDTLLCSINEVIDGELYMSEGITSRLLKGFLNTGDPIISSGVDALTDREIQIFEMLGKGLTSREIAEKLHLSPKTVDTHRTHIKGKLRVRTLAELTQHAVNWVSDGN